VALWTCGGHGEGYFGTFDMHFSHTCTVSNVRERERERESVKVPKEKGVSRVGESERVAHNLGHLSKLGSRGNAFF
jgi:hypothetical protein